MAEDNDGMSYALDGQPRIALTVTAQVSARLPRQQEATVLGIAAAAVFVRASTLSPMRRPGCPPRGYPGRSRSPPGYWFCRPREH